GDPAKATMASGHPDRECHIGIDDRNHGAVDPASHLSLRLFLEDREGGDEQSPELDPTDEAEDHVEYADQRRCELSEEVWKNGDQHQGDPTRDQASYQ